MTDQQIAADVNRGAEIVKKIAKFQKELKAVEARLTTAAQGGIHIPLQDENREGKQCLLRSPELVLPVRFTADSIIGSFPVNSPAHTTILKVVGEEKLPLFFKPVAGFARVPKDGEAFRKVGRKNLDPDAFAALIKAATAVDKDGIPKSTIQIAWDDAKPPEVVADA